MNRLIDIVMRFAKDNRIYLGISAVALVFNILTIQNQLPWVDEVMFTDSSANLLMYGNWRTHAWYGMGEYHPFALYVPLYQWMLFLWLKLIGFSLIKVRLFELLTTVILGWAVIKVVEVLRGCRSGNTFLLTFSILFWFFKGMCATYRLGRVDMLAALMAVACFYYVIKYYKSNKGAIGIVLFSTLTMLAGIQAVIWLFAAFVFSLFILRAYRKMLKIALYSGVGFSAGFAIACIWMWVYGFLSPFLWNTFGSSATFLKVKDFIKVHIMGMSASAQEIASPSFSLVDKIMVVFADHSMATLVFVSIVLFLLNNSMKSFRNNRNYPPHFLVLFGIFAIVFFNLAGRFSGYYWWASIIPMIVSLSLWAEEKNKMNRIIVGIASTAFVLLSLPVFGSPFDKQYSNITDFIRRQKFKDTDRIASPMMTFYEMQSCCPNTFYYSAYSKERIGDLDYIIVLGDGTDEYNKSGMEDYFHTLKEDSTLSIERVDSCVAPSLILYSVKKRNKK